jgi:hypothetical protein
MEGRRRRRRRRREKKTYHPNEEEEDDLGRHSSSSSSQQVLPHPCIEHTQAGQSSNYRLKLQSPDTKRKHGT